MPTIIKQERLFGNWKFTWACGRCWLEANIVHIPFLFHAYRLMPSFLPFRWIIQPPTFRNMHRNRQRFICNLALYILFLICFDIENHTAKVVSCYFSTSFKCHMCIKRIAMQFSCRNFFFICSVPHSLMSNVVRMIWKWKLIIFKNFYFISFSH